MKGKKITMKQGLVILCCMVAVTGCKQAQTGQMSSTYELMTVGLENRELSESKSATIRGRQDIDIYPQVSGTLTQLCVSEGQAVRNGQTLFIIDQVPYKAALQTAQANVEAAEANLATAELTYKSRQELYNENVVSEFDLSTARNSYLAAKAQLSQTKAQEVNASNNLSYTVVKSPCNGVVGNLPYRVGTLVSSAMAQPLTTVSDNSTMYVYFSLTENELLSLVRQYGSMDEVIANMPEIELQLNDGSIYAGKGKVESISGVIDRQTGTVTARAVFDNGSQLLHSGASGNVIIPAVYTDCIVIPQGATVQMQDKTLVYKVIDGKAVSALVTVSSISDGKEYIVLDGLSVGEEIVAAGAGFLREGTQVKY